MTENSIQVAQPANRIVAGRDVEKTATVRCLSYAVLSELVCSPHDIDARDSLAIKIKQLENARQDSGLEYTAGMNGLVEEFVSIERDQHKREYSALFEVGSDGPPCPIREDLQSGQRGGTREDLVRFYNFFNYSLEEQFAWAPDHLSVELEFMHFLCYHEAVTESDSDSFQFAQLDFSERHLVRWVPKLASAVKHESGSSLYARVIQRVDEFIAADLAWQNKTISPADASSAQ